jgi:hypothetical protein
MSAPYHRSFTPINIVREHHYAVLCGADNIKKAKKDHDQRVDKFNDDILKAQYQIHTSATELKKELKVERDRVRSAYKAWADYMKKIEGDYSVEVDILNPHEMRGMFDEEDFPKKELVEIYKSSFRSEEERDRILNDIQCQEWKASQERSTSSVASEDSRTHCAV